MRMLTEPPRSSVKISSRSASSSAVLCRTMRATRSSGISLSANESRAQKSAKLADAAGSGAAHRSAEHLIDALLCAVPLCRPVDAAAYLPEHSVREVLRPVALRIGRDAGEELRAVDDARRLPPRREVGVSERYALRTDVCDEVPREAFPYLCIAAARRIIAASSGVRRPLICAVSTNAASTAHAVASAFGLMLYRWRAYSVQALVSASSVFVRFFVV